MPTTHHEPERVDLSIWNKARRWLRREWDKRWPEERGHPSHFVSTLLREAEEKFDLGTFGDEGWCGQDWGNYIEGVTYLNAGDSYVLTLTCQIYDTNCVSFRVEDSATAWERFERRMDREHGRRHAG